MGYFVCVEPGVSLYVEDLNPEGKKTSCFCTVGRSAINSLNISLMFFLPRDTAASELTGEGSASRINR